MKRAESENAKREPVKGAFGGTANQLRIAADALGSALCLPLAACGIARYVRRRVQQGRSVRHAVEQVVARRRPIASVQPDEQALERAERATTAAAAPA